jgi:hypothetical protein
MQDKQKKVTLYLSSDLHRQLKIKSAVDQDPMSDLAEKAIAFYLSYPDVVENIGVGHIHQVYSCPECSQSVVIKGGELISLSGSHSQSNIKGQVIKQDEELVNLR